MPDYLIQMWKNYAKEQEEKELRFLLALKNAKNQDGASEKITIRKWGDEIGNR